MTKEDRIQKIEELLNINRKVLISDLVVQLHVSDMTIRRDLELMESKGMLVRTHGGAILSDSLKLTRFIAEESYDVRIKENLLNKINIAKTASSFILPSMRVFLDSGTTAFELSKIVPSNTGCTYITNAVNTAAMLLSKGHTKVITIGGEIDLNTWSARGSLTESMIGNFRADIAFLGCNAITSDGCVMIGNTSESGLKRRIIDISKEIYLIADSSKFNTCSLISYANVEEFSGIITDHGISDAMRAQIQAQGGNLKID